jgi:hypothetical protein
MIFLFLAELLRKIDIYSLHFKPNSSFLFMLIYGVTDRKLALEFIANFHLLWSVWDYVRWAQANLDAHAQITNLFTFWLDTLHTRYTTRYITNLPVKHIYRYDTLHTLHPLFLKRNIYIVLLLYKIGCNVSYFYIFYHRLLCKVGVTCSVTC